MSGSVTRGWINSRIISAKVSVTQLDATTNTTLATVPGCSHHLLSGKTYIFEAHITGTSTANGGAKAAIAGDGILSASQFTAVASNANGTTQNARTSTTTLGNAIGASTTVFTDIIILGTIVVNKPGLCSLQFAQNASHSDTSSAYVGSYIKFTAID